MNVPQTGRKPLPLTEAEVRKALRKRHSQDKLDFFATDPNNDIRTLGRLALRRDDINDLFALGDLCGKRALTDDNRLLVFYVGKALIAYQRALETARNDIDRNLARRSIRDFVSWTAAVAREHPSRRNVATSLWAIAEYDPEDTNPWRCHQRGHFRPAVRLPSANPGDGG
jgi:hypothetical protein